MTKGNILVLKPFSCHDFWLVSQHLQSPSPAPRLIPAETENQPRTNIEIGIANGGASLGLIVLSILTNSRSLLLSSIVPLLFFLLFWTFLLWGSPWLFARQQFLKQPSAQGEHTVSFNSDVITWSWDGESSVVEWKTYIGWMESKDQILLCSSLVKCGIVPKRALSTEQLSDLRTLLTQKLGTGLRV